MFTYLKQVRAELRHVVWPDWQTGVTHTLLIMLITAIISLYVTGLDYLFREGVDYVVTHY